MREPVFQWGPYPCPENHCQDGGRRIQASGPVLSSQTHDSHDFMYCICFPPRKTILCFPQKLCILQESARYLGPLGRRHLGWTTVGCPNFPCHRIPQSTFSCRKDKESVYPIAWLSSKDLALSYTANSWLQNGCVLSAETQSLQQCF